MVLKNIINYFNQILLNLFFCYFSVGLFIHFINIDIIFE